MIDLIIWLFWLAPGFIGIAIYWMKIQMEKLGYHYSIFNSSFQMMSDFNIRLLSDKKLKHNYYKVIIILISIWIFISLGLWQLCN